MEDLPDEAGGCKLWGLCRGRCGDSRTWRTPVKLPPIGDLPPGVHAEDRRTAECPLRLVGAEEWGMLRLWGMWKVVGGQPWPGSVMEQPARILEAFQTLEYESGIIDAAQRHLARRRDDLHRDRG